MPEYAIVFARSARKELEALDPPMIERVLMRIEALARDPRPTGARKLRGSEIYGAFASATTESSMGWTIRGEWSTSSEFGTGATPMDERSI